MGTRHDLGDQSMMEAHNGEEPLMPRGSTREVLRHLTTLCRSGVLGNLNDEQLLERFIELSDESAHEAFATLVLRHGPMVFGVCDRVLRDTHEAEDAFQATFLVLARKATSVIPRKGRKLALRRRLPHRERSTYSSGATASEGGEVAAGLRVHTPDEALHNELRVILDDELSCLPARYRGPIVLCELEGLTREPAAQRLGVPEGTSRAGSPGRKSGRDRLTRRGLVLPAGGARWSRSAKRVRRC